MFKSRYQNALHAFHNKFANLGNKHLQLFSKNNVNVRNLHEYIKNSTNWEFGDSARVVLNFESEKNRIQLEKKNADYLIWYIKKGNTIEKYYVEIT